MVVVLTAAVLSWRSFQYNYELPVVTNFDRQERTAELGRISKACISRALSPLPEKWPHASRQMFQESAVSVCRLLIEDQYRPDKEKRMQSVAGAGIMGGEKFKVGNVFFKFARDDKVRVSARPPARRSRWCPRVPI
jgi:hypothetical protein